MTIDTKQLNNGEAIEMILSGTVKGEEVIALQKDNSTKGLPINLKYILIDYSQVQKSYMSPEEINTIAENDKQLLADMPNLIIAAVVPNKLFHMVSILWSDKAGATNKNIKQFEQREDAEEWIHHRLEM